MVRLGEKEVVAKRGEDAGKQRRPQTETHGNGDDRSEKDEVGIGKTNPWPKQFTGRDRCGHCTERVSVWRWAEPLRSLGWTYCLLRNCLVAQLHAGDDMHADIPGPAHKIANDRAMEQLEPPGSRGFADDDLRDVVGLGVGNYVIGDAPVTARNRDRLAAKRLGKT